MQGINLSTGIGDMAKVAAGSAALSYSIPIAATIVLLLTILVLSYSQTIKAYPSSGGAYIVATENLGLLPGLVAGGSLMIDYILTVTVSVSAGTAALTSALPSLKEHSVVLCLFFIFLIMYDQIFFLSDYFNACSSRH